MRTTQRTLNTSSMAIRAVGVLLLMVFAMASTAFAQLPVPASSQFDISGFIQNATLGPGTSGFFVGPGTGAHQGGTITVNGHVVIVPSETIVLLPANALTWAELFSQAPAPYGPTQTGLALNDIPTPMTTYEAHVIGNRVLGGPGGPDVYIAGLIWISQHALNSGQGLINFIDYDKGEMRIGGIMGDANCVFGTPGPAAGGPTCSGARVRINDPVVGVTGTGRYSRGLTPDRRFTVDQDNPTIAAATGYPMCLPRVAPPAIDPACPLTNRPNVPAVAPPVPLPPGGVCSVTAQPPAGFPCTSFTMNAPGGFPGSPLDPTVQAPFMIGDFIISFAGTLVNDSAAPTAGPWTSPANTYISAHTISNNVSIYTVAGTNPAYVTVETTLIGTGGLVVIGANEATVRSRFEGFTSDVDCGTAGCEAVGGTFPSQRLINLYGIDVSPFDGSTSDRYFGVIGVDPGPPNGAQKGRWRFRPPCLAFGSVPARPDRDCVMNQSDTFLPPPREIRAVIGASQDGAKQAAFTAPISGTSPTAANGIVYGQYHAPIGEYIFPEALVGRAPIPENNFNTMPFLAQGGYTSSAGTLVGVLNPWPSNVTPPPICIPTSPSAGGPYAVPSGGSITLTGASGGTPPITYSWTVSAGSLSDPTILNPVFTAPVTPVPLTVTATLTATNCAGANSAAATISVSAASAPFINPIANQSVASGASGSFNVTASDPNVPPATPLTWTVSQTGASALLNLVITPTGDTTATVSYTAPAGVTVNTPITVTVTATNTISISASISTTVTITPAILPPVVNPVANITIPVGSTDVSLLVTGSDPNVPALTPLTFTVTQVPAGVLLFPSAGCALGTTQGNLCVTSSGPTSATISFNAPGAPTSVTLTVTAINSAGVVSAPVSVTVTITDVFSVTAAEYRTNKQRLIVNVTDNTIDPTIQMFLQPYRCESNIAPCVPTATPNVWIYDPDPAHGGVGNLFTGGAGGLYVIDVTGAPAPACGNPAAYKTPCNIVSIIVRSSVGGTASSALTRIR